MSDAILTLNAGSSSIKFALYAPQGEPSELARGQVESIGPAARLIFQTAGEGKTQRELGAADHALGLTAILAATQPALGGQTIIGVGHRIAHGGIDFVAPLKISGAVLDKLRMLEPLAPLHQPHNIRAIEAAIEVFPDAPQVAAFDTAFHRGHPWVNDTFALPSKYYDKGVRRYGFHGLSYDFITSALRNCAPAVADGRVVIAHLGNGASMCAVREGQSVASTMGFSALDGLPMGTRCGQIDPGVVLYLLDQEGMTPAQVTQLLYRESGLKGLSGWTNDMRALEASSNPDAQKALDYFVFRIRRELGAMCAVLGGIDALVFCGGIGENSATIRARVCSGMEWIGIEIDNAGNNENALQISSGPTQVLVIPTDEERVIARAVMGHMNPPLSP